MSCLRIFARPLSVLALFASLASAASAATVVDYSGLQPLANYSDVTTFGSTTEVAITTRSFANDSGKTTTDNNIELWSTGYSSLLSAVFATGNGRGAEITLTPIAGFSVNLLSFQLGSYQASNGIGPNRTASLLRVVEVGTGNVLWDQSGLVVNSTQTLLPGVSSTAGLSVQWGYDWNTGLNNLTFNAVPDGGTTVVPVPPAVALFLGGLGLLCFAGRKRS
jgi:hypothetical protein